MTVIKFMYYTDVHLQETNPPTRVGNYLEDVLGKMQQVMDIGRNEGVDFTMCGGDLFNPKKPSSTKHSLVTKVTKVILSSGVPGYCVPGNHDLQCDDMSSLPDQPLGVLFSGGVLTQVKNGLIFEKGPFRVHLDSFDFEEEPDLEELGNSRENVKADLHLLGAHIYSSPKGGDLFGTKVFSYAELSYTGHDMYLMGHYHPDNGVEDCNYVKDRQTFVNIGSMSRGDHGDENISRKPKCALITLVKDGDQVTWEVEQIILKAKPSEEVFDLVSKEKMARQKEETAGFVAEIEKAASSTESGASEEEELRIIIPNEKRIFDRTMEYINRARAELLEVTAK